MKLNIRPVRRINTAWQDLGKKPALVNTHTQGTASCKQPLKTHLHGAQRTSKIVIGGNGLLTTEQKPKLQMVLQVLANAGQMMNDGNAKGLQPIGLANAGAFEKLRALNGACREDDFFTHADLTANALLVKLHANGPLALKQNASDHGMG